MTNSTTCGIPGTYNGAPDLAANTIAPEPVGMAIPGLGEEMIDPAEAGFIDFINKATVDRLQAQFPAGTQPVLRDAHPKTHVLVRAEFIVLADLPEQLRYGIFKEARTYDALIRFSAGGIEVQADTVPQANGMAIKLFGSRGRKDPGKRERRKDPGFRDDQQFSQLLRQEILRTTRACMRPSRWAMIRPTGRAPSSRPTPRNFGQ